MQVHLGMVNRAESNRELLRLMGACCLTVLMAALLCCSVPDILQLRAVSRGMRERVRAALPGVDVRIGICLPDGAVINADECGHSNRTSLADSRMLRISTFGTSCCGRTMACFINKRSA